MSEPTASAGWATNEHGEKVEAGRVLPKPTASAVGLEARITEYLSAGGLFNPELMEHEKVRDLLLACRDTLADEREIADDLREQLSGACNEHHKTCQAEIQQLREQLAAAQAAWKAFRHELAVYDIGFLKRNTVLTAALDDTPR